MDWWRRFYVLRDENNEPGSQGGEGGDPPADPPEPGKNGDQPSGSIPLDVLPEQLRDRPVAEQKFLLNHMVKALGDRNREVEDMKEQLAELRGAVNTRNTPEPTPDPDDNKPLEELILEDTDKALTSWLRKRGLLDQFDNLANRVGETEFQMVARSVDDFDEYEDEVRALLKKSGAPATTQNIMGAYKLAVGDRVIQERMRGSRPGSNSLPPSNPEPPKPKGDGPEMSDLETEIMKAHGVNDPKEWARYRDTHIEVKLPT